MDNQVTVEISARHVHLSQADLETYSARAMS